MTDQPTPPVGTTPEAPAPEGTPAPEGERKAAETCAICGQSADKTSPSGDCPATDEMAIHNFTSKDAATKEGRVPRDRTGVTPAPTDPPPQ
jgi:hypothetical protein